MAITAAITLADSTLLAGQKAQATLTVSNSGGSDVLVTGIRPTISPSTAAVGVGVCAFGGPAPQTVAASGSEDFYFDLVGLAPQATNTPVSPASFDVLVGATVTTNDGSITEASTQTLTVSSFISWAMPLGPNSAAVILSTEFAVPGQVVQASLNIVNLTSTDVVVREIIPTASPSSAAVTLGACVFGGAVSPVLRAGETTTFHFNVVAHAPQASVESGVAQS